MGVTHIDPTILQEDTYNSPRIWTTDTFWFHTLTDLGQLIFEPASVSSSVQWGIHFMSYCL